jgi:D-lactate dehydrogenase (cytochrome)
VLVLAPEKPIQTSVFYFPGCGSERLHPAISMAAIHLLLELGTQVILPPPYLCCGFPAHVNAKADMHSRTVLRDTILFSQIREMFAHLEFDACVITCGTCREGLQGMEMDQLFGGRVVDIARYALERGLRLPTDDATYLYHAPCHDSLDGKAPEVLAQLGGGQLHPAPHCCSEAGTLALSRPDISDALLHRKRESLAEALPACAQRTVLTNCPSCVQGLGRNRDLGISPLHMAVALAERHSGPEWMKKFLAQAAKATAITF